MFEVLQRQISRSTRSSSLQINFDAKSCYDRIVPALAGITSSAFGLSPSISLCNTKTLQFARYHLKIGDKYHPDFYTNSSRHPIYGSGQGSGNSPFLWCFLSSILFDCFQNKCHGSFFVPLIAPPH